jgi:hypothetical protein
MKNNSRAFTFTGITLGLFFISYWSLHVFALGHTGPLSGLGFIAAFILVLEMLPVFVLLYISAVLLLQRTYHRKKLLWGNVLLFLALSFNIWLWFQWENFLEQTDPSASAPSIGGAFLVPVIIVICMWLFLSLPALFSNKETGADQ